MIHNISRFIAALALLLTAQGVWADTETVSYIDADGTEKTVTATVLTGSETVTQYNTIDLAAGWYVVKSNISYTNQISYGSSTGTIHIILADGAQMAVEYNGNAAISPYLPLAIYGQSAGTGRLSVTSDRNAIYASGGITINGGIVSATSTGYGHPAIYAYNGAITINGGQVTATPGDNAMGISTEGTITIGCRKSSDFVSFKGYNGTVNIKSGQTLYNGATAYSGNNVSLPSGTVTLRPYSSDDFSVNDAGTEYTIKTAEGWGVFCDLLADNTKGYFSGKTVALDADITVSRMAGGEYHDFTGTFDGGGHTLTFNHTATDNYCAPFRHVQGASAETPAVIRNLNVVSTVKAADYRHPAGLIALQSGYVSVTDCNVEAHINCKKGTVNTSDLYPAALVSQSNNTGVLTVSGCTTSGEIATDGKYAAGLIGIVQNTATITDCLVSVTIDSSTSGDGTHGGIVAALSGATNIYGTVFNGRLLGTATEGVGGFIGWRNKGANIYNSLFIPTEVTVKNDNSATFARNDVDTHNCYYTYYLCDGEHYVPYYATDGITRRNGHAPRTVAPAADVTIDAVALTGTATQYTVSGITAYSGGGLQRGETLYYGSGDQLSLTLSNSATGAPLGYQYGYTASAGTLSGTTLTMPDQDVTISATLALIDWATVNQGTSKDPYMIYNKDQLLLLAHRVNGTNGETANDYEYKYFKLGADITFDHDAVEGDNYDENYEAIGGYIGGTYRYFCGKFDGANHTVSGIRIRKTGSGSAYIYQGLFGLIGSGADIHDVHLTDARITGYNSVGGIVGSNNEGYIMRCSVTDSYITATGKGNYGTICGLTIYTYSLSNNYYHGCTVNGTAATSGVGCQEADLTDNHGALPAYRLALGENITTPPGTFAGQTEWLDTPPVDARLAPGNGFTLAGNHYFVSGYEFTPGSTLASGAAQGYTPRATLGGELLDPYTPTGDADPLAGTAIAQFTVSADCDGKTLASTEAIYSTRQPVTVAYINADGTPGEASAIALDGTETSLAAGTYFAGLENVNFDHTVNLTGNVTLILADNCHMNVGTSGERIEDRGINYSNNATLTITSQSLGDDMGALSVYTTGMVQHGILANAITIDGGNVTADTDGKAAVALYAGGTDLTINGGTVTATTAATNAYAIYAGDFNYNGGNVTATAPNDYAIRADGNYTFSWRTPADRITIGATGLYAPAGKNATFARPFTDGTKSYTGTLAASVLSGFPAETTLQPCLALADAADNTAAIADHAGQTLAVALTGRTLYKDGSWNTLCLPFSVTTASGTLSGDNVQAMTLDTTTSTFADGTLTLNFTAADETIPAGTPFIIKWDQPANYEPYTGQNAATCSDLVSPVFPGVTINAEKHDATVTDVLTFTGTYTPKTIGDTGDNTLLYLGAANTLYYPSKAMTIGTHRAYFQLLGDLTAGEPVSGSNANQIRAFNLNFGDDEASGIISVHDSGFTVNASAAWYTLDGRRLPAQPTQRGIYINNGKKVVVK